MAASASALKCAEIFFNADELRLDYRCSQCVQHFNTHSEFSKHFLLNCISDFLSGPTIIPPEDIAELTAHFTEFGFLIHAKDDEMDFADGEMPLDEVDVEQKTEEKPVVEQPAANEAYIEDLYVSTLPAALPTPVEAEPKATIVNGQMCVVLDDNGFTNEDASADDLIVYDDASDDEKTVHDDTISISDDEDNDKTGKSPPDADAVAFPSLPKTINEYRQLSESLRFTGVLLDQLQQTATDRLTFIRCDICKSGFRTRLNLLRHMCLRHGQPRRKTGNGFNFCCEFCGKQLPSQSKLSIHRQRHLNNQAQECPHPGCNRIFSSLYKIRQHLVTHSDELPYVCDQCPKSYKTPTQLRMHVRGAHLGRPYDCVECGKSFESPGSLRQHLSSHSESKPFACPEDGCGKHFRTEFLRNRHHERMHRGLKRTVRVPCHLCNRSYSSLSKHMQTAHSDDRPYVCETCGATFKVPDNYRRHLRTHTGERPYACDQCGKTFTQAVPYRAHMNVHNDHRPYGCRSCEHSFHSSLLRAGHERDCHPERFPQSGAVVERPFACPVDGCGRRFATEALRQRHSFYRHTEGQEAKPKARLQCDQCDKTYTNKCSLQKHNITAHSDKRPHVCAECGATFKVSENYRRHVQMHGREQKYACEHCDRAFATKPLLIWHVNEHTDNRPYKCRTCPEKFHSCPARNAHERAEHPKGKSTGEQTISEVASDPDDSTF